MAPRTKGEREEEGEEGGETQNKSQTLECVRILMFSPTHHPKSKGKTYEMQQQKCTLKTSHEMIQIRDGQTALHDHFFNCYEARALSFLNARVC